MRIGSVLKFALLGLGVILVLFAWAFAYEPTVRIQAALPDGRVPYYDAQNTRGAISALGFAIAGGLAFVASSIVHYADQKRD